MQRRRIALFLILMPLTIQAEIVSGIDQKFKLNRIHQKSQTSIKDKSPTIKVYQKSIRQTLGSHCDMYPNDSQYAQIQMKNCPKLKAIISSMARFLNEPDAGTINSDIMVNKKIYYVDLPNNCHLF